MISERFGIVSLALVLAQGVVAGADLPLVKDGKSDYAIYHDADAPPSVKQAAEDIQRVIRVSTGVGIPIENEPASPMICVGDNDSVRKSGFSVESLPDDSFLITTQGQDLYIVGKDTPGRPQWLGWASRGTLYGACDFLERVVGVRWLMPGEWGEDVPKHAELIVPEMSVKESPDFALRALEYVQERRPREAKDPAEVKLWLLRNKVQLQSEGRKLAQGHSWNDYGMTEYMNAHPECLAVTGDKTKFCTSNDEAVNFFAEGVIKWFDKYPNMRTASISPADGGGFCQCPKCQALVTKDPHGKPSYTLVILDFYNKVARIVAQKHPDRLLGGLVYYNYMYPPEKPVKMEPSLYLALAPLNYYGWGLAKPVYREEFDRVLAGWTALTPNFEYHNYSTWMREFCGAPVPAGLEILKIEVPGAKRHHVWGIDMVGQGAWGYGGVGNYILAKQMWKADVNVDELYKEWLRRAYGPGWQAMDELYRMLDARMMEWKRKERIEYYGAQYEVNYALIEHVHLPIFAEMEKLYLEAMSKAETEAQRKRLEMFGDNLIMLHYNMRKAGMLKEPEKSSFHRTDEAYKRFLDDTTLSLAFYREHDKRFIYPIWKGEWSGK